MQKSRSGSRMEYGRMEYGRMEEDEDVRSGMMY